jgi:hypothetical protein
VVQPAVGGGVAVRQCGGGDKGVASAVGGGGDQRKKKGQWCDKAGGQRGRANKARRDGGEVM